MPVPTGQNRRFKITEAKKALYMPATPKSDLGKFTPGNLPSMTTGLPSTIMDEGTKFNLGKAATDFLPYVSNIINATRKPPLPGAPNIIRRPKAVRFDFTNQRNEVGRRIRGLDMAADRNLDENSAAAVKTANLTAGLREKSSIAEAEANANAQAGNQANVMGLQADMFNAGQMGKFNDEMVNRELAKTRFSQQNLADAADKFIAQTGEDDKAKLDLNKLNVYSRLFKDSGVMERLLKYYKDEGIDPTGIQKKYGGRIKAFGGSLTEAPTKYPDGGQLNKAVSTYVKKPVLFDFKRDAHRKQMEAYSNDPDVILGYKYNGGLPGDSIYYYPGQTSPTGIIPYQIGPGTRSVYLKGATRGNPVDLPVPQSVQKGAPKLATGGPLTPATPGGDENIDIIVTDEDRKLLSKDSYTRNLFGAGAEQIYGAGFRPRMYGDKLIYTDNSKLFQTQGQNKQIGYYSDGSRMKRVFIGADNSLEYSDATDMTSEDVVNDIRRLHRKRSDQLVATNGGTRIKLK